MKVLIDTNVIISAVLFPESMAAKAFHKALFPPYEPLVSDYILGELYRKFEERFSDNISDFVRFLNKAL